MKTLVPRALAAALLAALALPVAAQDSQDWTGGYLGVHAGALMDPSDDDDAILFDTNLDGVFGDQVTTAAGANAFSPGFCDGFAQGPTPGDGCASNSGGADWGLRAGYDWQLGGLVLGVVGEWSDNDARDAVSAFSTTPARYTMLRKIDGMWAIRGRLGASFGDGRNLAYVTAGIAKADIASFFATSNGVNTFVTSGEGSADGFQGGLGVERRFGSNLSIGLEYLATRLEDENYRVRAQGPAPATNPFIRVNPAGTDFRRSDEDFDLDSLRLTATWRFGGRPRAEPVAVVVPAPVAQATCSDLDDDRDGVNNCDDRCPGTTSGTAIGADGCPVPAVEPEPVLAPQTYRG